MKFPRIESIIKALKYAPDTVDFGGEADTTYKKACETLETLMTDINGIEENYGWENREHYDFTVEMEGAVNRALKHYDGKDGFLCRLTEMAESEDRALAAEANYRLGRLYLGLDRPKGLKMPYIKEFALGFLAKAAKLGSEKAKSEYCLLAEYMGYYRAALNSIPQDPYNRKVREAYYRHRIRMEEMVGGSLDPALGPDGYVVENDGEDVAEARRLVLKYAAKAKLHYLSLRDRAKALELSITGKLQNLSHEISVITKQHEKGQKIKKRVRWLAILAYIGLMLYGGLEGPGNVPDLIYLAFLLPNTFYIFKNYEIGSLQDYLSAMPDVDERAYRFGLTVWAVLLFFLAVRFVWWIFFSKTREKFDAKKASILRKRGVQRVIDEAEAIVQSTISLDVNDTRLMKQYHLKNRFGTLDELAFYYHAKKYAAKNNVIYHLAEPSDEVWKFENTVPRWFLERHKNLAAAIKRYQQVPSDGPQYAQYEKTCALLCEIGRVADYTHYRPFWDVESFWSVGYWKNSDLIKEYCEEALLEMYQDRSNSGDKEASYRLAVALYPSYLGLGYAERARKQGHREGYSIWRKYDNHYNPPEPASVENPSKSTSLGEILQESLEDWAREHDERARLHNNDVINKARMLDQITGEEAEALKRKYGNPDSY